MKSIKPTVSDGFSALWRRLRKRSVDGILNLVLVIAQDYETGEVLMAAYASRKALELTLKTGKAHYYSTTRRRVWMKGESSGNTQDIVKVLADCDLDVILLKVKQKGGACHDGYKSCFYRKIGSGGKLKTIARRIFNPKEVY